MASLPPTPPAPPGAAARAFRRGLADALPLSPVLVPFGLVFGVVSADAGLDMAQVLGFSVLVLAGASQITAVQLLQEQAPLAVVLLSALAVNLRMAMYSASLVPWLGGAPAWARAAAAYGLVDANFALSLATFEAEPRWSMAERLAYFAAGALLLAAPWPAVCAAGAALGRTLPEGLGLDYAVPLSFIALVAPMLRHRAQVLAAGLAFALALAFDGLAPGVGLILAALVAMAAGGALEARDERRRAPGTPA